MDHLRIPLSDIESATNKFSTNCIGSGGFGTVYKAELDIFDDTISSIPEGKNKVDFPKKRRTVAVKRLKRIQGEVAGFFTEIEMLTNCKHPNIVSLLGISEEGPERILVYEHVSNGSLCDYFEKINNTKRLSWAQRLQICLDIAHGLDYLHSCTEEKPMIIHRDIKSDNILLDNSWVAKIADFGLSRLRPANQTANTINTGTIAGTNLYLDPEYLETGTLRKESDIYSFGVVLFEVVSGKLAHDQSYSIKNERGLLSIVQKFFNEGTLKNVIDPNLKDPSVGTLILDDGLDKKSLDTFFDIAYKCLAPKQAQRPTMKVIINQLETALEFQENKKDCFHISLEDLTSATKNFSDDKCIGKGRYWKQYEGHILVANRLTTVIVKQWDKNSSQARHEYMTELKILFERKHENIVALLGHCNESRERIIVYEHATYGSLDKHLEDMSLTWINRLKICVGIASGLKFLHEDAEMIHRDIKSSSILLDADWEPKICNFELSSKSMEYIKVEHATDNAYGSLGYLDPLHEELGYFKQLSDVYSLGVILMEILCGRLAWGEGCKDHSESLGPLARRRFKEEKLDELVFEGIKEQSFPQSFTTFASIAAQCLRINPYERPNASEVVIRLERALELQERYEKLRISLEDIKLGTENFSEAKFIAEGTYWKQYKGDILLANGLATVVVKRFDTESHEGNKQFIVEIEALFGYGHENIIRLAGYCDEVNEKIIVYQHASNGRLSEHLKDTSLTWLKRLKICIDVATGLDFLHKGGIEGKSVMIHRGINSGSILIDGEWKAIISNLELVTHSTRVYEGVDSESDESEEQEVSELEKTYAYGSVGYIDPKCKDRDEMTRASDIYSLGVVLMEILCGRLSWEEGCKDPSEYYLVPLAKRRYEEGNLDELVFEGIKNQIHNKSLTTFTDIAIQCLDYNKRHRPHARNVIKELQKALEYQEDYETWGSKLPGGYEEILHHSIIDKMENFKDIYDTLCKGFHLRDREVERYEKLRISLEDIKLGTENFSEAKFIAEGTYWKQYKGDILLANGLATVVVKRFDTESHEGNKQFIVEIEALFGYGHENIIRLAGYCDEVNEKIIVYQHASNGRLSEHLKDTSLTWLKRLKICIDVATGLDFLHKGGIEGKSVMIHRGINSGSILIDGEWKAIISNLELVTHSTRVYEGVDSESDESEEQEVSELEKTYAYGSVGYIDPKCKDRDEMTRASDIYSLGVVLMEILCGRLSWEEGCKDPSEYYLVPLAKRRYEEGNLDELVFEGIKNQIHNKSLTTFTDIAIQCLDYNKRHRPHARNVIKELQKALEYQEDYETWGSKLPGGYEEILHHSIIDKMENFKDIYDTLCKGFHLRDREVYFSLGSNGERNYLTSAAKFSYKNRAVRWRQIQKSRFPKVAKILNILDINIDVKMRIPFLSTDANYVVHLIIKFCDPRKSSEKLSYVNLRYKLGSQTFHAYFAISRDKDWMKIELCRFSNHKENKNFEVLLESFSQSYCGSGGIYVEGIEFQSIDNVNQEDIEEITTDVQKQLPTDSDNGSENDDEGGKLFPLNAVNERKHVKLSAMDVLYDSSKVNPFHLKPSAESRFQEGIELLPQQVFGIKCKIENQMLSPNTDYMCYLVFKLSEKCHGLHCPVRVQNVLQWKNKKIELLCFRLPSAWDLLITPRVPEMREDGWMEVRVWKFNSTSELRNDYIPMHLKLITYKGTMSGLIVSGLEIRPM